MMYEGQWSNFKILGHLCSYIVDHMKVVLYVYNTFYCAIMYHILQLHVR